MGSGLILLVIVGAWLVVLVPRALRSSDPSVVATKDRLSDAVRVLSRRSSARSAVEEPPVEVTSRRLPRQLSRRLARRLPALPRLARRPRSERPRATAATRRTRLLLALLALSVLTLVGAVLGPVWLLAPHLLADLLLGATAVHLHRAAVARAEREAAARREVAARHEALAARAASAAAPVRRPVHLVGIPDRMPPRPLPLGAPLTLRALRAAEAPVPARARGAQGATWSPVPVPPPTYLTAPVARRTVVDLTRPGTSAAERRREAAADAAGADEALDRKRAVNDW